MNPVIVIRAFLILAILTGTASSSARAAYYQCPATLDGHRLLNWRLAQERANIPMRQISGSADGNWTWSRGAPASIICGYFGTPKTASMPVSRAIGHCVNPEMTSDFHCD